MKTTTKTTAAKTTKTTKKAKLLVSKNTIRISLVPASELRAAFCHAGSEHADGQRYFYLRIPGYRATLCETHLRELGRASGKAHKNGCYPRAK
jgi:hypothetical protein